MTAVADFETVLQFWFGRVEETVVPSENRARIWFGEESDVDQEIKNEFSSTLTAFLNGECQDWLSSGRGQLAAIILLDQFSRHIYRDTHKAYSQDELALEICLQGIEVEAEHDLSLIERVFYYFPLLHAEDVGYQEFSVQNYQMLSELAFSETRVIFDSFLKFAKHHYAVIQNFGRFPQRNSFLLRESTPSEISYLSELQE